MAEFIDREEIYKAMSGLDWQDLLPCHFKEIVDEIPVADVAPVVHAHWEHHDDDLYAGGGYNECTFCGWRISDWIFVSVPNYCPNCGARMDEEEGK